MLMADDCTAHGACAIQDALDGHCTAQMLAIWYGKFHIVFLLHVCVLYNVVVGA